MRGILFLKKINVLDRNIEISKKDTMKNTKGRISKYVGNTFFSHK